jgi:hypothetical protein
MSHHHEQEELENQLEHHNGACCGWACHDEDCGSETALKAWIILQRVFLWGAFVCSLLTLLLMPKIIRKEIIAEQALKAWGIENYNKLNDEIYNTPVYKEAMKQQVDMFIQQSKMQMEMQQQAQQGAQDWDAAGIDPTLLPADEANTGEVVEWAPVQPEAAPEATNQ